MSRLKPVSTKALCKLLHGLGFERLRQKGSHAFYGHPDGRSTVVPIHPGEKIGKGLLHDILKDIELDRVDYQKLIRKS